MIPGLDILLGGLTGLIGNAFTTWFKFKNAKMEYEHNERMVSLETNAMIQKSKMQIEMARAKIEGEIEVADSEVFKTSQVAGSQRFFHEKWIDMIMAAGTGKWTGWIFKLFGTVLSLSFSIVDWLNGIMRPALTIYLVGGSSYITYLAWVIMEKSGLAEMTAVQAIGIFSQVTSTMIYLAVSAVTWWFGDRTMSKYLQQRDMNQNGKTPPTKPSGIAVSAREK